MKTALALILALSAGLAGCAFFEPPPSDPAVQPPATPASGVIGNPRPQVPQMPR